MMYAILHVNQNPLFTDARVTLSEETMRSPYRDTRLSTRTLTLYPNGQTSCHHLLAFSPVLLRKSD